MNSHQSGNLGNVLPGNKRSGEHGQIRRQLFCPADHRLVKNYLAVTDIENLFRVIDIKVDSHSPGVP